MAVYQNILEIIPETNENELELANENFAKFESQYFNVKSSCNQLLQKHSGEPVNLGAKNTASSNNIRLPEIKLKRFDGSLNDWLRFKDSFVEIIINNKSLSDIQRLYYLTGYLEGNAKAVIDSVQFSTDGFKIAWETLMLRYDNKRAIIEQHISNLVNLKPVAKESFSDLRKLLDECIVNLNALSKLGQDIRSWDMLIIHVVSNSIDRESRKQWVNEISSSELPTWEMMVKFLEKRCRVLESIENTKLQTTFSNQNKPKFVNKYIPQLESKSFAISNSVKTDYPQRNNVSCVICKSNHTINTCTQFVKLSPYQRYEKVKTLNLCINCLRSNHKLIACTSFSCRICNKRHHTLLHWNEENVPNTIKASPETMLPTNLSPNSENKSSNNIQIDNQSGFNSQANSNARYTNNNASNGKIYCSQELVNRSKTIMLSTAIVLIANSNGKFIPCRALLDSCSQSNFASSDLFTRLGVKSERLESFSVSSINNKETLINYKFEATIKSRLGKFKQNLEFLIVDQIANRYPDEVIDISKWSFPPNLTFADPTFNLPGRIDLLIGAEIFMDIMQNGRVKLSKNLPYIQKTNFGWIINGKITSIKHFCLTNKCSDIERRIDREIPKLWENDNCDEKNPLSLEEKRCEEHFKLNYSRDSNGRFIVRLPFKDNISSLGNSKEVAIKRFLSMERRLSNNSELKRQYVNFMNEYLELEHMELSVDDSSSPLEGYYFPHHSVLKPQSTSTKLRVVFDGSSPTDTGLSLNDLLMIGPTVQDDLISIMLRFRQYLYVFTSDIQKMYRQIKIHEDDLKYQKILWRTDTNKVIETYKLKTITYGTASAPYLATRALKELAIIEATNFPLASRVTISDFYVDDLLTGSNRLEEALEIQSQLVNMLAKAGMKLRKWTSNTTALLENIDSEDIEPISSYNKTIKTLGIEWQPDIDLLHFSFNNVDPNLMVTKRTILSEIAKLFDPLGLLTPIMVTAKLIIQTLWLSKVDWDGPIPTEIYSSWVQFRDNLSQINTISIKRCLIPKDTQSIELHGFADASERAYGACIYIRCVQSDGNISTNLLCSKSRVAPLKVITMPRLELNAIVLLSKLTVKVLDALNVNIDDVTLWSDSSIALSWIKLPPHRLKTYVANRTTKVQELTASMTWRYVKSKLNPADILSRGVMPQELASLDLWWHGPSFIFQSFNHWPETPSNSNSTLPDLKDQTIAFKLENSRIDIIQIDNYSSFPKIIRIVAYCLRYMNNCNRAKTKFCGNLSVCELTNASNYIIRNVQSKAFKQEINCLRSNQEVPKGSKLMNLTPFIDSEGILRVGGRLQNSSLQFGHKHQIVLPKHHLTTLIIRHYHSKTLHGGLQTTLSAIREKYWPINAKHSVKGVIRKCIPCFKVKPKLLEQIMGNLPSSRTEVCRPFSTTGIDYCGPFLIKYRNQRKGPYHKVYVCIFICFATKAVHIDIVDDATSEAFIACLKRFFARRGKSSNLVSDNGTNFVGAHNELRKLHNLVTSQNNILSDFIASEGIGWQFIPPRSPHFGGLWESAVKIFKSHFKRVTQNQILFYEQLRTLVIQIEGIMNSRPLMILSSDPNDSEPLTPGHFLTGGPITSIIEPLLSDLPINRLSYWQRVNVLTEHFWKRFSKDYLHTLQQRQRWQSIEPNLNIDDIVLVHEENSPPTQWLLGKIESIILGNDKKVRVAVVKTKNGTFRRAIAKLAKLPVD